MSKIRTFVATPVISLVALQKWLTDLKKQPFSGKIKWSDPHLWHLTFKFFGDVEETQLNTLTGSLLTALDGATSGSIKFEGAGYFGSSRSPKVIWAGIGDDGWLYDMKNRIEKGVSALGIAEEERPFHPHLTLGRVKYLKHPNTLIEALEQKKEHEWGTFEVNRMVLYKSKLTSQGPVYSELESFWLQKGFSE